MRRPALSRRLRYAITTTSSIHAHTRTSNCYFSTCFTKMYIRLTWSRGKSTILPHFIISTIILRVYPFLGFALIRNNLSLVYRLFSWFWHDHDVGQSNMLQCFIINIVVLRRYFFKGLGLFLNIPSRVCDSLRDILFNRVMCSTISSWWWRINTFPFASLCIYPSS